MMSMGIVDFVYSSALLDLPKLKNMMFQRTRTAKGGTTMHHIDVVQIASQRIKMKWVAINILTTCLFVLFPPCLGRFVFLAALDLASRRLMNMLATW